jgi:general secretion pathway protein K
MAVLMALLLVALAASASALVLWQQRLWWQQLAADRRRAEMHALADAGLALAMARLQPVAVVGLGDAWARPGFLQEDDGKVEIRLADGQGRFNLNGLAAGGAQVDAAWLETLRRLLASLQLPDELAGNLVRWRGLLTRSQQEAGLRPPIGQPPLARWDDLARVPGFTPERMARLAPYATVLPEGVRRVNVNTASAELLTALLPTLPPGAVAEALSRRTAQPYRDVGEFLARAGSGNPDGAADLTTGSDYFLLRAIVRHGHARRSVMALLKVEAGRTRLLWRLDRAGGNFVEEEGGRAP